MNDMKLIMENWRQYAGSGQQNRRHAELLIESFEKDNQDLFFENLVYLNEGVLDFLNKWFLQKPTEMIAKVITKLGEWLIQAIRWISSKAPDSMPRLKSLVGTISSKIEHLVAKATQPRVAMHVGSLLVKTAYVVILLKLITGALAAKGLLGATEAGTAAAQALASGDQGIEALNAAWAASDPNAMAQGATQAMGFLFQGIKYLEAGKIVGYSTGALSPRRGILFLGKKWFQQETTPTLSDLATGMIAEYKHYRKEILHEDLI